MSYNPEQHDIHMLLWHYSHYIMLSINIVHRVTRYINDINMHATYYLC